jgi:antitoxin YefM
MSTETTYTYARDHLAELLDRVEADRETVVISRRGHEAVALVAASELASLRETVYLLRSPANARRLLEGLAEVAAHATPPQAVADLRRDLGLDEE